jgi:hypothetical protein
VDPFAGDVVTAEPWPHLRVHKVCCIKCQHPDCDTFLPTVKRCLMPKQLITYCSRHARKPPLAPQPSPPAPAALQIPAPHPPAAKTIAKATVKSKPTAAQLRRVDKLNPDRRTPSVAAFFADPAPPAPVGAPPDNRRFIRDKQTSEIIGYWRQGQAYNVLTNEPFREREAVRTKFDFSPPGLIEPPAELPPLAPSERPAGLPSFADLFATDA